MSDQDLFDNYVLTSSRSCMLFEALYGVGIVEVVDGKKVTTPLKRPMPHATEAERILRLRAVHEMDQCDARYLLLSQEVEARGGMARLRDRLGVPPEFDPEND